MDFEVAPTTLRRVGGELDTLAVAVAVAPTATYHAVAPDHFTNAGWATTGATDLAVAAAQGALMALAGRARGLGDGLRAAADAYEQADERVVRRFAW